MIKLAVYPNGYSWAKRTYVFDTIEEAQKFAETIMSHLYVGDEEDEKQEVEIYISFQQKITNFKEEE